MTIRMTFALAAVAVLTQAASTSAVAGISQTGDCSAGVVAAPGPLGAWTERAPLEAASDEGGLAAADLPVGRAADLALTPTPDVRYAVTPERPGAAGSHGGLVSLRIETDGVYRIALGTGAWIDIVGDGRLVASTRHGHGPDCSGIRKMVDFPLARGDYVIQITGAPSSDIAIMVVAAPL